MHLWRLKQIWFTHFIKYYFWPLLQTLSLMHNFSAMSRMTTPRINPIHLVCDLNSCFRWQLNRTRLASISHTAIGDALATLDHYLLQILINSRQYAHRKNLRMHIEAEGEFWRIWIPQLSTYFRINERRHSRAFLHWTVLVLRVLFYERYVKRLQ